VVSHNGGCAGASTGFDCLFEPLSACSLPQLHKPPAGECADDVVVSLAADTFNVLRMINPQLDPDRGAYGRRIIDATNVLSPEQSCARILLIASERLHHPSSNMWRSQCGAA